MPVKFLLNGCLKVVRMRSDGLNLVVSHSVICFAPRKGYYVFSHLSKLTGAWDAGNPADRFAKKI